MGTGGSNALSDGKGGSKPFFSLRIRFLVRTLVNLTFPSTFSNSSCLPRCTPFISFPFQSLVHFPLSLPQ